jgi:uncharacterized protein YcbX
VNDDTEDLSIASLHLYPIKSCAGIAVDEALVIETGLEFDRAWMVVDEHGVFVTQRELPRLALVRPTLRQSDLVLRAPGMLPLHLLLDTVEAPTEARVWNDTVRAYDMGALAAQWFSNFLGRRLRLARFDPEQRRLSDAARSRGIAAENAFSDAFPLLVTSTASLAALNERLAAQGAGPVTLERLRPNLVLDGLAAHGEDHLDEIVFDTDDGPIRIRIADACTRCSVPDVDPATGEQGHAVGDALAAYRADARKGGAITFGMNAAIVEGVDRVLRRGLRGRASLRFD